METCKLRQIQRRSLNKIILIQLRVKQRPLNIRRNYFGYKILASKSPDWQIDVDQSIDQLIIIDLSCLLVQLSRLARITKLQLPGNLRILSNSCYQCFYVLTFILMEIYLFAYTQPLWFSSTRVLRTLKNWSVGILSWRLGPQLQIRTHGFYAFGIFLVLFTLNCTKIYILRRETGKNWVGWSAVLAAQPEKKLKVGQQHIAV